jgi:AraC-like DNA-binding protein
MRDRPTLAGMDAIAGLLDGPRARRAFLLRCSMDPPWALRIEDQAPLSVIAVLRGSTWLSPDSQPPELLEAGDIAIVRGPEPYTFGDDPNTAIQAIIHPDQRCTAANGRDPSNMRDFDTRRWGNSPSGQTEILTGTYNLEGEVSRRLLDALPSHLVLRHEHWQTPLVALLADEMTRNEPGQDAVLDRLLDLVLIDVVRTHFAQQPADAPGWYRAQQDPDIAKAVRLLQDDPGRHWDLHVLASELNLSRSTLARRFSTIVGQPPMEFLTQWRLTLAADLMLDPTETIASVANKVGYTSPYALSTAFKRVRGVRPGAHRHAQRANSAARSGPAPAVNAAMSLRNALSPVAVV